ncbi:MAG: hypothetical protein FWG94_11285 [Oscillospiraceae bacterium]|nr:hypothetical protein [Oscillospiraceae bacterium]
MKSEKPNGNPGKIHGNKAKIDKSKDIVPVFSTVADILTYNEESVKRGESHENASHAKEYVDENHK